MWTWHITLITSFSVIPQLKGEMGEQKIIIINIWIIKQNVEMN